MSVTEFESNEIVSRTGVNSRIEEINNMFPLTVENGGTGKTSLTSGQILLGNGTSGITSTATLPVSKGGTGGTTKSSARTNLEVFTSTQLYANSSGSSSTISLSSSIQNFNYIEIFTINNDGRRMSIKFRVNTTSHAICLLSATAYKDENNHMAIALKCSNVTVSGSSITWGNHGSSDLRTSSVYTSDESHIKIYRVIGYSY